MSNHKAGKLLLSLSLVDSRIVQAQRRRSDISEQLSTAVKARDTLQRQTTELEAKVKEAQSRHDLEQQRLQEEERRIVERRKQLSALGGTRGAKLVEREIEIAARALAVLEQRTLHALETFQSTSKQLDGLREELDRKSGELSAVEAEEQKVRGEVTNELNELTGERDTLLNDLEDRIKALYKRVASRYPIGAVARAEGGACRSCYRALPVQTYNQVLAGNVLIQCPGCNRILVSVGEHASS